MVTKTDLAEAGALAALHDRLKALNPAARRHEVVEGVIAPGLLFNAGLYDPTTKSLDVQRWLQAEAYETATMDHARPRARP